MPRAMHNTFVRSSETSVSLFCEDWLCTNSGQFATLLCMICYWDTNLFRDDFCSSPDSSIQVSSAVPLISINQSIKFLKRQYPRRSQAQWRDSQIGVQIQSRWSRSVTSTGSRAYRCLRGKGQVEKVSFETSSEGGNRGGWPDRYWKVVPKRRGAWAEGPCASVGLHPRDGQSDSSVWSQWAWWKRSGNQGAKVNGLFLMKSLVGQQADLEMNSIFYW